MSQNNNSEYLPHIDGLRAIAVILVVLFHIDKNIFSLGYLGVDIFFVISGYLISNIIISDLNNGTFSFKNFHFYHFIGEDLKEFTQHYCS